MADNKIEIEAVVKVSKAAGEITKLKSKIEELGPAGKRSSISIANALEKVRTAADKVKKAIETISFGTMLVNSVMNIIEKINQWREAMRKAEVEAQKLKNAAIYDAQAQQVESLSTLYKKLCTDIEAAGKAAAANEQTANAALQATRAQEDAALNLKMEQEVATLDRNDPAYSAKVAEIRQRYAGAKNIINARRGIEDAQSQQKKYADEAYQNELNAATYAGNATTNENKAKQLQKTADNWRAIAGAFSMPSKKLRDKELAAWIKNGGDASMLQMLQGMTEEEASAYAKKMEQDYGKQASAAAATAKNYREKEVQANAAAKTAAALAQSQQGIVAAAKTNAAAVKIGTNTASNDAAAGVAAAENNAAKAKAEQEKKQAEEAAKAQELARAQQALPELQQRKSYLQAQINAQTGLVNDANFAVYQAQGNLELAQANGNRNGIAAATGELNDAKNAAFNVQNQANATIKSLTDALNKVNEQLKAAENAIAMGNKQQRNFFAEIPAGE